MTRDQADAANLVDNDRTCVSRFTFEPGAETGWHTHGYDYVIVAVTECHMLLEEPGGNTREVDIAKGESYFREAGVEHNVVNRGDKPMSFVEVELK